MSEQNYIRIQILSVLNLLVLGSPLKYYIFTSRVIMVVFAISSLVCVIINYKGIKNGKVNKYIGVIILALSIICLFFALNTLMIFFPKGYVRV